jgi:hypothetical protein
MTAKAGTKKSSIPKRSYPKVSGSAPPMKCSLSYETAASLEHLINAQSVHATRVAEDENLTALLDSLEQLKPFWTGILRYLENPR